MLESFNLHPHEDSEIDHTGHDHGDEFDLISKFTIPPDSSWLKLWNIMISLLCIYSSYLYGWIAAFSAHYEEPHKLVYVLEGIFFANICISFLKQYVPEGEIQPE